MTNTTNKGPNVPPGVKQGIASSNILAKLKIPDIEITKFKSYQHRTKEWREVGYRGEANNSDRVHLHKSYNVYIKGFPAWRIGFKNNYKLPVDILMHFSVHDKFGLLETFTESYSNLRPTETAEIFIIQDKRKTLIRVETVEVFTGYQPLSSSEVKAFLPRKTWSLLGSFLLVFFMGVFSATIVGNHQDPDIKGAAIFISLFAFFISIWELFNITAVMLMFFLLLMVPFSLSDPKEIMILLGMGGLYLWSVWKKRYSIKDFLIGAFIA